MSGWGQHLDHLAGAVTQLLHDGAAHPAVLVDPRSTLAARDAVLAQLRELVGAVADVPTVVAVRELTLHDTVHRPSQSLHQALSELPRAISFGEVELPAVPDPTLTDFERFGRKPLAPPWPSRRTWTRSVTCRITWRGMCCAT